MDHSHKRKVEELFEAALDRATGERTAFLAVECENQPAVFDEVKSLLAALDGARAESFMQSPAIEMEALLAAAEQEKETFLGRNIGHYTIVERIGAGGMGTVYKAGRNDDEYQTKVAIKLIRRGMDTEDILNRFRRERQILANLNHPNIAHLLEGGTTQDGLPYFVMEYIEGQPLIEYCDEKRFSIIERLKLFRMICSAVQHAHQNLVIHRDLKPSNILVTQEDAPKLLDFGIAKILHQDSDAATEALTAAELRVLTPEYASPEQVRGEAVNVSSDVYSLGVVLYELLTGQRPYRFKSRRPDEIARVICEQEPDKPSTAIGGRKTSENKDGTEAETISAHFGELREGSLEKLQRRLRGDLDNIILMALRKEPQRRYATVEQFSEDIRRHLEGLPVLAHKNTFFYQSVKFIGRNKIAVTAAVLIALTLIGGIAATTWQADQARRERAKAESRFNDVRRLANSFLFEFHDSIENLPGSTVSRELVVNRALEYLDKLSGESEEDDAELQRELATAYERIGKIQGNSYYANLGDTAGAMKSYKKSLEMRQKLAAAAPADRALQNELAASFEGLGDIYYTLDDLPNGLQNYERALSLREPLVDAEPDNAAHLRALSELYAKTGDISGNDGYSNLGDTPRAIEYYLRAVAIGEKLLAAEPGKADFAALLGHRLQNLAMLLHVTGQSKEGLITARRATSIYAPLVAGDAKNMAHRQGWLSSLIVLRYPLLDEGYVSEATENARIVVREMEKDSAADPRNVQAQIALTVSYNSLGKSLTEAGDTDGAVKNHSRALKILESLFAAVPTGEVEMNELQTRLFLGEALLNAGRAEEALKNFRICAARYEEKMRVNPNIRVKDELSSNYAGIGKALLMSKDEAEAIGFFNQALPLIAEVSQKSPHNSKIRHRMALRHFESGKAFAGLARKSADDDQQNKRKACELFERSFQIWDEMRQKEILVAANVKYLEQAEREFKQCR